MATAELKRKLLAIGAVVFPLIAVKAASVMLTGPGPQYVQAETPESQPTNSAAKPVATTWSERQIAAQHRIAAIEAELSDVNPLLYVGLQPDEPEKPPEPPPPEIPKIEPPKIEPPPDFQLHVVMSGARGDTALIDGRPYRVGDHVRDTEWKVHSIHVAGRATTLVNAQDGRTITIMVDLPLPRE